MNALSSSPYVRRSPKRAAIKGIFLSLAVNGFLAYADYQQHGVITPHDWTQIAISVVASSVLIVALAVVFDRLLKSGKLGPRN